MKNLFGNKFFQFIGIACQIYVGLGWLGVVGGFSDTGTIFSVVGGLLFLVTGLASLWDVLRNHAPHQENRGRPEPSSEVLALARAGNMIAAIKVYREQTGAGLREAREAIENITVQ
ncbi:MAG: hypothetical protein RKO68_02540 [Candidatus Accumulibacter sp.]|nr:hypothetical protein [Accumulibacter sp.]